MFHTRFVFIPLAPLSIGLLISSLIITLLFSTNASAKKDKMISIKVRNSSDYTIQIGYCKGLESKKCFKNNLTTIKSGETKTLRCKKKLFKSKNKKSECLVLFKGIDLPYSTPSVTKGTRVEENKTLVIEGVLVNFGSKIFSSAPEKDTHCIAFDPSYSTEK